MLKCQHLFDPGNAELRLPEIAQFLRSMVGALDSGYPTGFTSGDHFPMLV